MNGNEIMKIPEQVDLFSYGLVNTNSDFSNLLVLYDQLPLYVRDKQHNGKIKTQKVQTLVDGQKRTWTLTIEPHQSLDNNDNAQFSFSGGAEELVMSALIDIALTHHFLNGNKVCVPYSVGEIVRRLSDKGNRMNNPKVRKCIRVLSKVKNTLEGEEDGKVSEWHFSQISELRTQTFHQPNGTVEERGIAELNPLVSQQIIELQSRLYNFERFKMFNTQIARPLYKILCIRYTYATESKSYTTDILKLRALAGLSTPDEMQINKRRDPCIAAFDELIATGVLSHYELLKTEQERNIGRKPRTVNEFYKLFAGEDFIKEQKKASAIANEMRALKLLGES